MPVNNAADGTVLTASFLNTNYRDQVVSTVTSGTHPSGTEGQMIVETDTDNLQIYSGAAWKQFGGYGSALTWTPQLDQGASTNIAKTITTASYVRIGNIVYAWCQITITGAGSAGSSVTVTLPVAPSGHSTNDSIGGGQVNDAGTAANCGPVDVWFNTGSQVYFRFNGVASGVWGSSPNMAVANTDSLRFHVQYLVA